MTFIGENTHVFKKELMRRGRRILNMTPFPLFTKIVDIIKLIILFLKHLKT